MWVEWTELWLCGACVLQLTDTAQDACAIRFFLTTVHAHAELDREPVDSGQATDLHLGCAERGDADFL